MRVQESSDAWTYTPCEPLNMEDFGCLTLAIRVTVFASDALASASSHFLPTGSQDTLGQSWTH